MATSGTYYVYEHWRLDRDECFYVGKGRGGRAYSMKNRNRHHQAIVAKMARIGLAFEVRIVAAGLSEQEAFDLECERIAFWRNTGVDLTNMTPGGEGNAGTERSPETRLKLSLANKGKKRSEETRKLMSAVFKGRVVSAETRKKLAERNRGAPSPFKGRKHTEETKKTLSEIAKKRGAPKLTKEQQEKVADWHRGRKRSSETCKRISEAKKGKPSYSRGIPSPLRGTKRSPEICKVISEKAKERWAKRREECGGVILGRKLTDAEKLAISERKKEYWRRWREKRNADV